MKLEWLLFLLALAAALLPILWKLRSLRSWPWAMAAVLLAGTLAGAGLWDTRSKRQSDSKEVLGKTTPREERFLGYASSDKCQACHPNEYASWHRSYHRTMTQVASPESVKGNFDNITLDLDGETYRLYRQGNEFWADMIDPDWLHDRAKAEQDYARGLTKTPPLSEARPPRSQKRIGMTTGSHNFQAYWVSSLRHGNVQFAFPFAWIFGEERWVPRKDTFIRDPHASSPIQIWNVNCVMCHATLGQPRQEARSGLFSTRVAEMGIACESCHGPAEAHVRLNLDPRRRYQIHSSNEKDSSIVNPSRLEAKLSAQVCGQCHSIKWNLHRDDWLQNGFRYRPGEDLEKTTPIIRPSKFSSETRLPEVIKQDKSFLETIYWPDGVIRVTGREYNGLVDSACYERGNLSCLSCHSMHQSDPIDQLTSGMNGNQACFQCHESFRNQLEQHTHHRPGSSGSQCYNCHMPHDTYGLLKAVRSHYIHSPSPEQSRQAGRPNACNLCHLDKTLEWTGKQMQQWYGTPPPQLSEEEKSISAALLWLLRGDAAVRALVAWNMGWEPARAASGEFWLALHLTKALEDPYSAVRYIVYRSLKRLPGYQSMNFDYVASPENRAAAQKRAWEIWETTYKARKDRTGPTVLIGPNGDLLYTDIDRILQQRDNRAVELIE